MIEVPQWLKYARRWGKQRYRFWHEFYVSGEQELRELPKYVSPQRTAIDVGGNIGIYTYHLHRLAAKVVTFEPNPEYVDMIKRLNLPRNSVEPVALSNCEGSVTLRIPRLPDGRVDRGMATIQPGVVDDHAVAQSFDVRTRRLDEYQLGPVGFIKVDVEGHEEAVLEGAAQTIMNDHPAILIEIEERHNPGGLDRIAATLGKYGYRGYYFSDGKRHPVEDLLLASNRIDTTSTELIHRRRGSGYINNFLFTYSK